MLHTIIHTHSELSNWLADNFYFDDCHVLSIKESPLELVVGYNISGNYKANSEREILSFKITPIDVVEWTYDKNQFTPSDDNYLQGIDAIENENGLCIEFAAHNLFRLTAKSLKIEELEIVKTIFKPWVSNWQVFGKVDINEIPKPEFWKMKLNEYGHDVLFRYYMGDERQPEDIPYPDYQGYYIQLANRISFAKEGIFLKHIALRNDKLNFGFELKDEELKNVWFDFTRILSDLPNAQISSGNCEFTGSQWKQYLIDGKLPK